MFDVHNLSDQVRLSQAGEQPQHCPRNESNRVVLRMTVTLRRAQAFVSLNDPELDDFDVFHDSHRIGRVYRRSSEAEWRWTLSLAFASPRISGRAPSRVLAVGSLADLYDALKRTPAPESIPETDEGATGTVRVSRLRPDQHALPSTILPQAEAEQELLAA